jgi:predicted GNAT family N-acyltransferase
MKISGGDQGSHLTHRPFENLKALLGDEEPKDIVYRTMQPGEEKTACSLVSRVFNSFVAPQYSQEGVDEFLKFADPDAMAARTQANHLVIVAETNSDIVGMIEMRDGEHICLLFVDEAFQRRGIARELLRKALETCARNQPCQAAITVNSSPNAVEAYQRLGFQMTGTEQLKSGIRFVPMTLNI